jgi:hypothetical protein
MIYLQTSNNEARLTKEVLEEVNFSHLFDLDQEQESKNTWVFGTPGDNTDRLVEEFRETLAYYGLSDFNVSSINF